MRKAVFFRIGKNGKLIMEQMLPVHTNQQADVICDELHLRGNGEHYLVCVPYDLHRLHSPHIYSTNSWKGRRNVRP